ncbi:ADOP family duplicated permease [Tunturiibacter gelidoferens]|uniref:Permease n=1 Tax=Tunturiibacter gelidiferens TaxID=3069689 RepID=A0A9X0QFN4_9BACT|nr:ADOP family duplicated permease [Edaphobacter lichenicola]MBB5329537.1 putative permease [Edaphobacter lichenicola]
MSSLIQDIRYAIRQLLKSPGFAITAILSLVCGIAATSAVFSVVWGVVMNPYPYAAPDRMVHFALGGATAGGYQNVQLTAPQWQQLRQLPAIEDSILLAFKRFTITGSDLPEDVQGTQMTSNASNFFGVPALIGRGLLPSDASDDRDPQPIVVLGYKFWQRRFNGDPAILGKTIQLDHQPYNVVGVAAKRFVWNDADVYLPLKTTAGADAYTVEARLKPGVSHHLAEQQMQPLLTQFEKDTPRNFGPKPGPLTIIGLNDQFMKAIGPSLALLFGAVLLLLAIGCGNVSILLLARGVAREHEFAVRAAIGASRARIVRQLLTEALLLSVTGAALGVLLAYRLLAGIIALLPEYSFPHEAAFAINLPVLSFSVAVALLTGIFFGLWPALRLSRPDVREAMQTGTRKVAGTVSGRALHSALIAGQIALTLLLLSAAGAAVQSFLKLAHTHLGYDPHNTMSLGIPLRDSYSTLTARSAYVELLRNKVAEIPGINMVAVSANATPPNNGLETPMELLGQPSSEDQKVRLNFVSEEYFPLLKISLLQGRLWTEAENHNANLVAVINETFAHKYFPKGDAIGHSIQVKALKDPPSFVTTQTGASGWLQIIGVTEDKLDDGMSNPVVPEVSIPYTLAMWGYTQFLVRTDGPPAAMIHTIGLQVASVDHDQQIGSTVRDLEHWISTQPEYAQGQLLSWLFAGFAVLALLLAAVGLYSVVSYTVSQRTNEFGIRMALGAPRGSVLELVVRSAITSVGTGVAVGILLTILLQKGLAHWATATNQTFAPLLYAIAILASVVLIASGIPARRATQIEPMEALRYE